MKIRLILHNDVPIDKLLNHQLYAKDFYDKKSYYFIKFSYNKNKIIMETVCKNNYIVITDKNWKEYPEYLI